MIEGHAAVDEILAVTFTEKAADEMKRRISGLFDQLGMQNEKRAVENAYIGTIHGFCARVLRENPFEAGIDPEFDVMSETDKAVMMNRAWDFLMQQADETTMDLIEDIGEPGIKVAIRRYIDLNRSLGRSASRIEQLLLRPEILIEQAAAAHARQVERIQEGTIEIAKGLKGLHPGDKIEELRCEVLDILGRLKKGFPDPLCPEGRAFRAQGGSVSPARSRSPPMTMRHAPFSTGSEISLRSARISSHLTRSLKKSRSRKRCSRSSRPLGRCGMSMSV